MLGAACHAVSPAALESSGFAEAVIKALADKNCPAARKGSADAIKVLSKSKESVKALELVFISSGIYTVLLKNFTNKMPVVRTVAVNAVRDFVASMNPWATALVLPALLHEIKLAGALTIHQLVKSARKPSHLSSLTPLRNQTRSLPLASGSFAQPATMSTRRKSLKTKRRVRTCATASSLLHMMPRSCSTQLLCV